MPDWKELQYLRAGNYRQQRTYAVVQQLGILATLCDFDPVVVGTIPLAIDLPASDIDIICEVPPLAEESFGQLLQLAYDHLPGFQLRQFAIGGYESVVSSFHYEEMEIEIFGQALPTAQQNAFRHLLVEHAVLQAGGESWRAAVRQLKQQGLKTELAFAALLQLPGNPYDALLTLEKMPPAELAALVAQCPLPALE